MLGKNLSLTRYSADAASARWPSVESASFHRLPMPVAPTRKTTRAGWCHPDNPLLDVSLLDCKHEPWWHIGLRVDTWAAPGRALKHALDVRKREWLVEMGRERVPSAVVSELRDALYGELARPTTQHCEVAWNLGTGTLLLGSATQDFQAALESTWRRTWEASPARYDNEHLGTPRFLLWLWHRFEHGHTEQLAAGHLWDLWIDEEMGFEGGNTTSKVKSNSAGTSRPSYASLTAGLMPVKVRLGFSRAGRDHSVMLQRPPEEVRSLRFTAAAVELGERLEEVEECLELLDTLGDRYRQLAQDPDRMEAAETAIDAWKTDWNRTLAPAEAP